MSFARATIEEVLDDLSCRFLINIPEEESLSAERLGFQIEEAHWFYDDFIRIQNATLPSLTLKAFSLKISQRCPLLNKWTHDHEKYYNDFLAYKLMVPVCGAIILNPTLDKCLFVRGYNNKASWGFPRGKVDLEEDDHFCAIREIKEEIGFDITPYLVTKDCIDTHIKGQRIKLYIVPCIPESVSFQTQTRKEIGRISWVPLSLFPKYTATPPSKDPPEVKITRFYNVHQFMPWAEKYMRTPRYSKDYERAYAISNTPIQLPLEKKAQNPTQSKPSKATKSLKPTNQHPWLDFHFDTQAIMSQFQKSQETSI